MLVPQAFYSTRGTPLSAYHRTKELTQYGHTVDILTYPIGAEPPDLDAKVYRSRGPHFWREIKQGPSMRKIWFDWIFILNAAYRISRSKYDLIYAHEEGAFMARLLKPFFKVPYIYDMHSSLRLQIEEWNFSRSRIVKAFFAWVEKVTVAGAKAIVAISPAVADVARNLSSTKSIVVIVNKFELGMTPSDDSIRKLRNDLGIKQGIKIVCYTGSFVALQALDLLIQAVPRVRQKVPLCKFVLVGGQQDEIRSLVDLTNKYGVQDAVIFVPPRPQQEMPIFMALSDVLVSPRVRGINPPGKLFAYLASGKPVVATDTLVHNQILDNQCAFMTPASSDGLADGLITALTDKTAATRVCDGAKALLNEKFSAEARKEAFDELIASAL